MTDIERVRSWINTFEGIPEQFKIDYTSEVPNNAGLFPSGLVEISRRENVWGETTVTNQYNFGLYCVFPKPEGEDDIAKQNADWVMDFQKWVQEQSVRKLAPTFGNFEPETETFKAQNGTLYEIKDAGVSMYMVLLSAQYKNFYGE